MSGFIKFIGIAIFSFALVIFVNYFVIDLPLWLFLVLVLLFLTILVFGVARLRYGMFVKPYISAYGAEKKIALTFDDGPCANTLKVLDLLKKYGAKGTFFCIGKNVENHPDILKRIDKEGHVIGNHTYSHGYFIDFLGKHEMIDEIRKTEDVIRSLTHKKTRLFRPPYGVTNPPISKAISETGYDVIGWNIRSFDTIKTINEKLINRIIRKISSGAVLLLHDRVEKTAVLLERILIFAREHGYECVGVDDLFKIESYE